MTDRLKRLLQAVARPTQEAARDFDAIRAFGHTHRDGICVCGRTVSAHFKFETGRFTACAELDELQAA